MTPGNQEQCFSEHYKPASFEKQNRAVDLMTQEVLRNYLKMRKCKALTRKQMLDILELMDHREQRAQLKGYEHGRREVEARYSKNPLSANDKSALLMTFQRLGDANAQMATTFCNLLKDLNR